MTLIVSTLVSFPAHADFWSRLRDAAVSAVGTVVTVATSTVAKMGTALGIGQCNERLSSYRDSLSQKLGQSGSLALMALNKVNSIDIKKASKE